MVWTAQDTQTSDLLIGPVAPSCVESSMKTRMLRALMEPEAVAAVAMKPGLEEGLVLTYMVILEVVEVSRE